MVGSIGRSKSRASRVNSRRQYPFYAICVYNKGNLASLVLGKAYRVIRPRRNDSPGMLRVVDEDREDYLYDARQFVPVSMDRAGRRRMMEVVG